MKPAKPNDILEHKEGDNVICKLNKLDKEIDSLKLKLSKVCAKKLSLIITAVLKLLKTR